MSQLTEAEKRRILRERRQKKFSSGGGSSRLNKITGHADSLMNTESSLDSRQKTPERTTATPRRTPSTDEIPTDDVTKGGENNPQVSILKQLAGDGQESVGQNEPDIMSMFQSMVGGDTGVSSLGQPVPPADQEWLDYHNYLVNRLKAWSIVMKWAIIMPYVYLVTHHVDLSLPQWLADSSNFFSVFVGFEIVATSLYYSRLKSIEKGTTIDTIKQNSLIAKLISLIPDQGPKHSYLKSYVFTLLQYWDVVSMLITDVCFVLIVLGIFSYM
ncbi:probable Golgi to ER traffic protein 2 [Zygosaccharomyces bailii ISA1307]|nr:probable Golgi to ER traffic protein 2 [Zygosaccharomyces bailii ISA1307]